MKKNLFLVVAICTVFLTGCSTTYEEQEYPLKITKQNQNKLMRSWCIIDEDTGVNYIVVDNDYDGISITPRLNSDGSLYTSK